MSAISEQTETARWSDVLWGIHAPVSAVLAGGIILHAVNINISATMLPSIVAEIGGQGLYAWNATLFTLAAILSAAVTGKILQRLSARVAFALSGLVFAAGSLITAGAPDMPVMLIGRSIQGVGGGMMFTLCYSMIVFAYPERLWSRAVALLSGTWGIAMLFGPAVGGMFAEYDAWRGGFAFLIPVTGLITLMAWRMLPNIRDDMSPAAPIAFGQLALLAGSVLAVSAASLSSSPTVAAVGVISSVALILVLMHRERTSEVRLFPRGAMVPGTPLFLSFAVMSLLIFCVNAEFFMPFYLQRLHGLSPLLAGYIAALVSIGWASSEVYSARFTGAAMHRTVLAGPLVMLVGTLVLATVTPLYGAAGVALTIALALALVLVGAGIGVSWPHLNTFALQFTDASEKENAASALSTIQMFAVSFGTAVAGLVANFSGFNSFNDPGATANSSAWLFATFAGVAVVAGFASKSLIATQKARRE
ncbi:MAG: MFS transporter [Roseibium sp.]|uniref:MFS transporter n=1 Tax=Roseibium sp. TaxID=1936156 RepID=UPI002621C2A9|nr:MFS transporter [Roseibium sp.]MCV0427114.1 MFS transporter [Roseibium sp.]